MLNVVTYRLRNIFLVTAKLDQKNEAVSELKIQEFRKIKFGGFVMLSLTGHRNALVKG